VGEASPSVTRRLAPPPAPFSSDLGHRFVSRFRSLFGEERKQGKDFSAVVVVVVNAVVVVVVPVAFDFHLLSLFLL
jgi:hypothetical protein